MAEQIAPFGDRRGDIQAGIIAMTVANMFKAYVAGLAHTHFTPVDINEFMLPLTPRSAEKPETVPNMEKQITEIMFIQQVHNMTMDRDNAQSRNEG